MEFTSSFPPVVLCVEFMLLLEVGKALLFEEGLRAPDLTRGITKAQMDQNITHINLLCN